MAYDRQFLSLRWGFSIKSSEEIANTGCNFSLNSLPFLTVATNLASIDISVLGPQLLGRMQSLLTGTVFTWFDWSQLRYIRIAAVGTDGHEIGDAKIYEETGTLVSGANSQTGVPQASVCVGLRSGSTTGGANYGRMYIPHTRFNTPSNLAVAATSTASSGVTVFKTFLSGVKTDLDAQMVTDLVPFVMSSKVGQASKPVAQIAIGCVTDTQRRRRNRLEETYQFGVWP